MPLKAQDIFTPGSFTSHTYVSRSGDGLEKALRDAIDTPGQIVSLIGAEDTICIFTHDSKCMFNKINALEPAA